jgi:hypothetical protein
MQKQGLLHQGWCFPPEGVVIDASHAETGTFTSFSGVSLLKV